MSKHDVHCIERCRDSATCKRYFPGDQDEIESTDPIAKYFSGWPPGTQVYEKTRGNKTTPPVEGLRTVPGVVVDLTPPATPSPEPPVTPSPAAEPPVTPLPEPPVTPPPEPPVTTCDLCGMGGWPSEASLRQHKVHCAKKQAAAG